MSIRTNQVGHKHSHFKTPKPAKTITLDFNGLEGDSASNLAHPPKLPQNSLVQILQAFEKIPVSTFRQLHRKGELTLHAREFQILSGDSHRKEWSKTLGATQRKPFSHSKTASCFSFLHTKKNTSGFPITLFLLALSSFLINKLFAIRFTISTEI